MTEDAPEILVSWHEASKTWVAITSAPPTQAKAASPKTAVNRVYRALSAIVGRRAAERAIPKVAVPHDVQVAWDKYRRAAEAAADKRRDMLRLQMELGQLLLDKYGLNRSQAAAVIGFTSSYFGKVLDGKFTRHPEEVELMDPAEALAEHVRFRKR